MDPFDDINDFEKMMKKMLEGFFGKGGVEIFTPMRMGAKMTPSESGIREPLTDINETKTDVIVTMELPGTTKNDISLDVSSTGIEISARTKKIVDSETLDEHSFTHFKKFMNLPSEVDPDSVNATYKNGILEIYLKKLTQSNSRKVKIK